MTGKVGRKLLLLCRWLVESLLLKGTLLGCQWGFCWCLLSVIGVALLFAGESVVVVALFAGDHSVVVVALFAGDCLLLLGLVVVHGIIAVHGIVVFRVFVLPE